MRKEIIYSLAAVAAIPVMANATESNVNTQVVLSATTENHTGEMTLATDVALVKADKYQLVFGKLNIQSTPTKPFTVTITGKKAGAIVTAQEVDRGGDSIRVDFTLPEEDEITIKVTCEEPYAITDPFINLIYDFEKAADDIEAYASKVVLDTLVHYVSNDNNHYTSLQTDAKAFADSIRHAALEENEAIAYENVYKRFHLYDAPNDSVIQMIKQRSAIAKQLEVAALTDSLTELTDSIDKLFPKESLRGAAYNELNAIGDSIEGLISKFAAGEALEGEEDPVSSPDVQNALKELKNALGEAAQNKEFYDKRQKDVDTLTMVKKLVMADLKADLTNAKAAAAVVTDMETELDGSGNNVKSVRKAIEALQGKIDNAYAAGDLKTKWSSKLSAEKDSIWKGTIAITANPADTTYKHDPVIKSVIKFIHEKYTFLALHSAFADSVLNNPDTFAVQKFSVEPGQSAEDSIYYINYKKSLQYQKTRYNAVITRIKGATEATKLENAVKDSVNALVTRIWEIADTLTSDKTIELTTSTTAGDYSHPEKKHYKALSDSTYKVIKALEAYEAYAPFVKMDDSIQALIDSLAAYKLDSTYSVTVKVDGKDVTKTYKPSDYVKTCLVVGGKKVGLSIDSIRAEIAALRDTVSKIKLADAETKANGEFMTSVKTTDPKSYDGYNKIKANIKALGEAAVAAAQEWEKIQKRLLELEDSAYQVRKLVEKLPIYTRSVKGKNGVEYGNYKLKIDSIMKSKYTNGVYAFQLDKALTVDADGKIHFGDNPTTYQGHSIKTLTDSLKALKGAVAEGTHTDRLTKLYKKGEGLFGKGAKPEAAVTDTTAIDSALQALKANYKNDSIAYDSLAKAALLDTLKASVRKMIESLHADSLAIMLNYTDSTEEQLEALKDYYGEAGFESLAAQLKSLFQDPQDGLASVTEEDALAEATKPNNNEVDTEKLRQYAEKIRPLVERMQVIKEAAENYRANQVENAAKYDEAKKLMKQYENKFKEAIKLVAKDGSAENVFKFGFAGEARWYADSIGHVDSLYFNTNPSVAPGEGALYAAKGAVKVDTTSVRQKDATNFKSIETAASIDSVYTTWRKAMQEDNRESRLSATWTTKWQPQLVQIIADLDKAMADMRARQRNYDAFELITKLYPAVNSAIGNAMYDLNTVEDSTAAINAYAHYADLIAKSDTAFRGKDYYGEQVNEVPNGAQFDGENLKDYKKVPTHNVSIIRKSYGNDDILPTARRFVPGDFQEVSEKVSGNENLYVINSDTIIDNGVRDNVLKDYLEQKSVENQMSRIDEITTIINTLGDVAKLAQQNKANYTTIQDQWNTDSVKRKAVKDSIDAYPLPDGKAAAQALWNIEDGRLNNIKPKELYANGQLENDKVGAVETELTDIWNKLDAIRLQLLTGDDLAQAVAENNNGLKDKLADKIQEARDTYKDAVDLQNQYQSVTNPLLRQAMEEAQDLAAEYNNTLATFPKKINDAKSGIEAKINAATEAKKVYPDKLADNESGDNFEDDTVGINKNIIEPLKTLRAEFAKDAMAAVKTKLNEYLAQAAKDTLRAKFYRDSVALVKGSTDELADELAGIIDKIEAVKKVLPSDSILLIQEKLNALYGYETILNREIEAAAAADLTGALAKALEIIEKGDEYYKDIDVNVPSAQATEKQRWERAKLLILGDDENEVIGAVQLLDSVAAKDTTYTKNYFAFSTENKQLTDGTQTVTVDDGEGYQIAKYFQQFFDPSVNPFVAHNASKEALDILTAALADVQTELNKAIKKTEDDGYAVAGMMQRDGNGFDQVQQGINRLLAAAKMSDAYNRYNYSSTDSAKVAELLREIKVIMTLQVDSNEVKGLDNSVDSTLYAMEKDFLYGLRTLMNTQFNKIAAVAAPEEHTDAERAAAKVLEDKIKDLYHDLDSIVAQKAKDKDSLIAKAEELLPIQQRAEELLAELTAAAGDTAGVAFAKLQLKNEIDDMIAAAEEAKASEGLEDLNPEQRQELEAALDAIKEDLDNLKDSIDADDNFFFNEEEYKGQIADAQADIQAAVGKAQFQSGMNAYLNQAIEVAEDILDDLKDYIEKGEEALATEFETVDASDFSAKIARIWNQIAKGEAILDSLKDGKYPMPTEDGGLTWKPIPAEQTAPFTPAYIARLIYTYAIGVGGMMPIVVNPDDVAPARQAPAELEPRPGMVSNVSYYRGSLKRLSYVLKNEMDMLLNAAAQSDAIAKAKDLQKQANAIQIDEDKLLESEYHYFMSLLNGIQEDIFDYEEDDDEYPTGLLPDAYDVSYVGFEAWKKRAEAIQERIDALKKTLSEAGALKSIVGDVNGDGIVDEEDYIALIGIVRNQLEETLDEDEFYRADMDGNERITVTDIILLRDVLLDLDDDDDDDEREARGWFDKNDGVTLKNLGSENGVTRVAVMLDNEQSYRALQLDLQLGGATVKAASLGERTQGVLFSNQAENGNFRLFTVPATNEGISGNEGAVIYLDIEGAGEITGTATFTTQSKKDVQFDLSGTTAIDKLKNAAAAAGQQIYNLGGRMVDGLKKGVNILRGENGETKKVIKK